jgi:nucleoside-diphosphate-sugar epimerase
MKEIKLGITGSTGVLGTITCDYFLSQCLDVNKFNGDIRNSSQVDDWIKDGNFTHVIHFASLVATQDVENDPIKMYYVNVMGTLNVISSINSYSKNTWLFYSSTSHVYNSAKFRKSNELSDLQPRGLYGSGKLMAEQICLNVANKAGIRLCIGRIFSFYHHTQTGSFLYPSVIKRLKVADLSKAFKLNGGDSIRDISKANHIVDKIVCLLKNETTGVVNIGSGKGIKIKTFVKQVAREVGKNKITIESIDDEPSYLVADITKYNKIFIGNGTNE